MGESESIRLRVQEYRVVPAADLVPHEANWREHPASQRAALQSALQEIGFAGACLVYPDGEGRLHLIDGHLRWEGAKAAGESVPCLVTDLTTDEADRLLSVYDGIGGLARPNADRHAELLARAKAASSAFGHTQHVLHARARLAGEVPGASGGTESGPPKAKSQQVTAASDPFGGASGSPDAPGADGEDSNEATGTGKQGHGPSGQGKGARIAAAKAKAAAKARAAQLEATIAATPWQGDPPEVIPLLVPPADLDTVRGQLVALAASFQTTGESETILAALAWVYDARAPGPDKASTGTSDATGGKGGKAKQGGQ